MRLSPLAGLFVVVGCVAFLTSRPLSVVGCLKARLQAVFCLDFMLIYFQVLSASFEARHTSLKTSKSRLLNFVLSAKPFVVFVIRFIVACLCSHSRLVQFVARHGVLFILQI